MPRRRPRRPDPTRRPRGLLGAGAVLLAAVAVAATPCVACSCAVEATVLASAQRADVVFVGTLVDTRTPVVEVPGLASTGDPVAKVFDVGGSCGLEVEVGRTYVVVASSSAAGLTSTLCGGTRLRSVVDPADLDAVGAATSPRAGTLPAELPVVSPVLGDVAGSPVVWGSSVVLLGGAVGVVVVLVRRRRSASGPAA